MITTIAIITYIVLVSTLAYWVEKRTTSDVHYDRKKGVWVFSHSLLKGQTISVPIKAFHELNISINASSAAFTSAMLPLKNLKEQMDKLDGLKDINEA